MKHTSRRGMTLIEVLVATAIFIFVSLAVYQAYTGLLTQVNLSRVKITATNLANEQFEIAKNLPYSDVGTVSGLPNGKIPPVQTLVRDGKTFTVTTTVRNIDDPFDGVCGGSPNDCGAGQSPADYRLVEVNVVCDSCKNFTPMILSSRVSPKALEGASTNGVLAIKVFDASGIAVSGANIHVVNSSVVPAININDVTSLDGVLYIVDAPPSSQKYGITVSKSGYSTDRTYPPGDVSNPNPLKADATVLLQQVTNISFAIDRVSTVEVVTERSNCTPISSINFDFSGAKLIGSSPDVKKYSQNFSTNGSGLKTINNLEWDVYSINLNAASYYLSGTISPLPFSLLPDSSKNVAFVLSDIVPNGLLVAVKDNGSGLPLSNAEVNIENGGVSETRTTGRGYLRQTDWSEGYGEATGSENTGKYWTDDGHIENGSPNGTIKLKSVFGTYFGSGTLESSTFDTGSAATFYDISWSPQSQPVEVGVDSAKFQVATSNDVPGPWNFAGPDGTDATYFTLSDRNINATQNNKRYFRYKAFLETADTLFTPTISDVALTFTSSCAPPGQVLFNNLSSNTYTLTVSRTGYQTYVQPVDVNSGWQLVEVPLLAE